VTLVAKQPLELLSSEDAAPAAQYLGVFDRDHGAGVHTSWLSQSLTGHGVGRDERHSPQAP
jgi:hypothetical protein